LKICIVDADVIIHLMEENLLFTLGKHAKIQVPTTIIEDEIFGYTDPKTKVFVPVDFRKVYVESEVVEEVSAGTDDLTALTKRLPKMGKGIDPGETEALAIVLRDEETLFCSCDVGAIHTLPYIDATERGVSVEGLFKTFGITLPKGAKRNVKLLDEYFKNNIKSALARFAQNPPGTL
jgi:hypothetical protein